MSGNAALVFDVCHARLEFLEERKSWVLTKSGRLTRLREPGFAFTYSNSSRRSECSSKEIISYKIQSFQIYSISIRWKCPLVSLSSSLSIIGRNLLFSIKLIHTREFGAVLISSAPCTRAWSSGVPNKTLILFLHISYINENLLNLLVQSHFTTSDHLLIRI